MDGRKPPLVFRIRIWQDGICQYIRALRRFDLVLMPVSRERGLCRDAGQPFFAAAQAALATQAAQADGTIC